MAGFVKTLSMKSKMIPPAIITIAMKERLPSIASICFFNSTPPIMAGISAMTSLNLIKKKKKIIKKKNNKTKNHTQKKKKKKKRIKNYFSGRKRGVFQTFICAV